MLQTDTAQLQRRLELGIRQVFDAGQGCMTLTVVGPTSAHALVAEAMNGSACARAVLVAADRLLRKIARRSHACGMPCLFCDNVMWRGAAPGAVGVLTPYGIVPVRTAVGLAICADCTAAHSGAGLSHAAVEKFREGMMPDLRVFQPMPEAGHA